ncbi:uncharacterized protein LOC108915453 [Anoplophora glabripennis]|uniref:uncharacterized protein LOC108915453 n=1 Tax=Anoplophora glabripennis TaxID=217634 RepID=UPI000875901A|nr:uncharacterized protein LOC108915453 [Anoplophora glabripennis]
MSNVEVSCGVYIGDIFVECKLRSNLGKEHCIGRCITSSQNPIISILNTSNSPIVFQEGTVLARGEPCVMEQLQEDSENTVNLVQHRTDHVIEIESVQVDDSIGTKHRQSLLDLLNEFTDCFARSTSELGNTQMNIVLTDDKPVTYRPYKLSQMERSEVREIIDDLLQGEVIREFDSPYASPILLVKKKQGNTECA